MAVAVGVGVTSTVPPTSTVATAVAVAAGADAPSRVEGAGAAGWTRPGCFVGALAVTRRARALQRLRARALRTHTRTVYVPAGVLPGTVIRRVKPRLRALRSVAARRCRAFAADRRLTVSRAARVTLTTRPLSENEPPAWSDGGTPARRVRSSALARVAGAASVSGRA